MQKHAVFLVYILGFLLVLSVGYAHVGGGSAQAVSDLRLQIIWVLSIAGVIAIASVFAALRIKPRTNSAKWVFFLIIAIPVIIATLYLFYSTVSLNIASETKGPVHWHADFEVFICDQHKDLINATGFSNLVGNPVLHEHGDNRVHVEGVLLKKSHATLASFFNALGGVLSNDVLIFPTDSGIRRVENMDKCPDGTSGMLQVFVYHTTGKVYKQVKLKDFEHYVISPYSNVPPGDCLIIEFGKEKEQTRRICESYNAAIKRGDIYGS